MAVSSLSILYVMTYTTLKGVFHSAPYMHGSSTFDIHSFIQLLVHWLVNYIL